jgi:hypothetical protein
MFSSLELKILFSTSTFVLWLKSSDGASKHSSKSKSSISLFDLPRSEKLSSPIKMNSGTLPVPKSVGATLHLRGSDRVAFLAPPFAFL